MRTRPAGSKKSSPFLIRCQKAATEFFASAASPTLLPLFVIVTLLNVYSCTKKPSPSSANVSINVVFQGSNKSKNTEKDKKTEKEKNSERNKEDKENKYKIGTETLGEDSGLRLLEDALSDAQDVSFGLAATGPNGWEWNKQVNYGEEISLKAPVGSVSFLLRLTMAAYPAPSGAALESTSLCEAGDPTMLVSEGAWSGNIAAGDNVVPLEMKAPKALELVPLVVQVRWGQKGFLEKAEVKLVDAATRRPVVDPCAKNDKKLITDATGNIVSAMPFLGNSVPLVALLTLNGVQRSFATNAVKLENIGFVVVINVTNPSTLEGVSQVATLDTIDLDGNGTPDGTDIKAGRSPLLPQAKLAALGKLVALSSTVRKDVLYCTFTNVSPALQRRFHPKFLLREESGSSEVALSSGKSSLFASIPLAKLNKSQSWNCEARVGESTYTASAWKADASNAGGGTNEPGGGGGNSGTGADEDTGDYNTSEENLSTTLSIAYNYASNIVNATCTVGTTHATPASQRYQVQLRSGNETLATTVAATLGTAPLQVPIALQKARPYFLKCALKNARNPATNTGVAISNIIYQTPPKIVTNANGGVAILRRDGSVVTFGHEGAGGKSIGPVAGLVASLVDGDRGGYIGTHPDTNNNKIADSLEGGFAGNYVFDVVETQASFAAVRTDGAVVTWGAADFGGMAHCSNVANHTCLDDNNNNGIAKIFDPLEGATQKVASLTCGLQACAALRANGSVVT